MPNTFLSTLSLRRATGPTAGGAAAICISIHALLAESDRGWTLNINGPISISIHALLAESDIKFVNLRVVDGSISIHALLAESDSVLYA